MRNSSVYIFMIRPVAFITLLFVNLSLAGCYRKLSVERGIGKFYASRNELEDDVIYFKRNGRCTFFTKNILLPFVRIGGIDSKWQIQGDTIRVFWPDGHPRNVRDWLSNNCILDSAGKSIRFYGLLSLLEERTMNKRK